MIRAGVGQSADPSTERAAEEAATQAVAQAGIAAADTAVVFFTADHAAKYQELTAAIDRITGCAQIVGCSTAGVLTSAGEIEGRHGLAVLLVTSDRISSHPFLCQPLRAREEEIGGEIAQTIGKISSGKQLLALFPDTYNAQPQLLLQSIRRRTGFLPVVGAGASESGAGGATYQLCGGRLASNAVAGLHLSGSLEATVDITQGCQPVTRPMVITKAEKNLIFEIDHRPAFEVFAGVLKGPLAEDLRRALMFVFVGLPATAEQTSIVPGEYVVRNIIGLDPAEGVVAVAEDVREGEPIVFALRDGQRAREDLGQMLQRQAQSLKGVTPSFGIYFNCCARGSSLYGIPGIDTAYIRQHLGDFPLIGMFGGYEIAPLGNTNHLFAYTGVLALITESENQN
ncbi:MAG: FIST signal transduction protein [Candidatus Binatia bacterium]